MWPQAWLPCNCDRQASLIKHVGPCAAKQDALAPSTAAFIGQ